MPFKKLLTESIVWRGLYFLSTFILNILVARYFQASMSGWLYYISNLYALVLMVSGVSLESGMTFFTSKKEISLPSLLNFSIAWTSLCALVIVIYNWYFSENQREVGSGLFLVSSVSYICGNMLTTYCAALFYGSRNFRTPNRICIGCNLFLIIVLVANFIIPSPYIDSEKYLYLYFLTFLLQGILLVIAAKVNYSGNWQLQLISLEQLRQLFRYSLTAFAANLIFFLLYRIDYLFVKRYCSAEDLGNYIQVAKIGQVLITVPSILASVVFPFTAGGQNEEVKNNLKLLSRLLFTAIGCVCVVLVLCGPSLFPLVFGPSFNRMYSPFILLVPGILSISALYPLAAYYSGRNMISVNIIGSFIALLFIVAADLVFIPVYGIKAAALVSSAGYIIYHAYVLQVYKKEYNTSVTDFFRFRMNDLAVIKKVFLNPSR